MPRKGLSGVWGRAAEHVGFRALGELVRDVERWATANGCTRSEACRRLLTSALEADPPPTEATRRPAGRKEAGDGHAR